MNDNVMPPNILQKEALNRVLLVVSTEVLSGEEHTETMADILTIVTRRFDINFRHESLVVGETEDSIYFYRLYVSVSTEDYHRLKFIFARDFCDEVDMVVEPEYLYNDLPIYALAFPNCHLNTVKHMGGYLHELLEQPQSHPDWGL